MIYLFIYVCDMIYMYTCLSVYVCMSMVYVCPPNHLKVDFADIKTFYSLTLQPASSKNQNNLLYDHSATQLTQEN